MKNSEFGKGQTYNLALFLMHNQMIKGFKDTGKYWATTWFNASSDHLYEFDTSNLKGKLKKRAEKFRHKVLELGHGSGLINILATEKDVNWAIDEAKQLLMLIDKSHGIKVVKGDFE